jgi:hypothetical protein
MTLPEKPGELQIDKALADYEIWRHGGGQNFSITFAHRGG